MVRVHHAGDGLRWVSSLLQLLRLAVRVVLSVLLLMSLLLLLLLLLLPLRGCRIRGLLWQIQAKWRRRGSRNRGARGRGWCCRQ